MPLRGLRRSPFTRPRNARRESSEKRSSWARKSAESNSWPDRTVDTILFLVQRLEVFLHLPLEVARHLLPRDGFFHHLPVLAQHAQVLEPGGHLGAATHHVGVEPVLLAWPRFPLDPDVVRRAAEPRRRIALGSGALATPGQQTLALREVSLVAGSALVAGAAVAA